LWHCLAQNTDANGSGVGRLHSFANTLSNFLMAAFTELRQSLGIFVAAVIDSMLNTLKAVVNLGLNEIVRRPISAIRNYEHVLPVLFRLPPPDLHYELHSG